jgi:intraflagellar transport protein 122
MTIHSNLIQGRFKDAAELYCKAGQVQKAMEMFADLHMFDEAKELAARTASADCRSEEKVQEIIQKQAAWTEEKNDHATAADMYLIAGQLEKALALIAEHGPPSKLIEVLHVPSMSVENSGIYIHLLCC